MHKILHGPFTQIVTMAKLPESGPISNDQLEIVANGGVLVENGLIIKIDDFDTLIDRKSVV